MEYYHIPTLIKELITSGDFCINTECDHDDFQMITKEDLEKILDKCEVAFSSDRCEWVKVNDDVESL